MSLVSASICPHPPLLIPGVSPKNDRKQVRDTKEAMEELAKRFKRRDIDLAIIITPHGSTGERFNCPSSSHYNINLPGNKFSLKGNEKVIKVLTKNIEELSKVESSRLDHGVGVPAYFIKKEISDLEIIPINYSKKPREVYFQTGKKIKKEMQKVNKNIALIGSGDLSHKLKPGAPGGFSKRGKEFDKKFIELIKNKETKKLLEMEGDLIRQAGECGYKSTLMVLGAVSDENWNPEILSYEGPFGVGYSVIEFKIDEN